MVTEIRCTHLAISVTSGGGGLLNVNRSMWLCCRDLSSAQPWLMRQSSRCFSRCGRIMSKQSSRRAAARFAALPITNRKMFVRLSVYFVVARCGRRSLRVATARVHAQHMENISPQTGKFEQTVATSGEHLTEIDAHPTECWFSSFKSCCRRCSSRVSTEAQLSHYRINITTLQRYQHFEVDCVSSSFYLFKGYQFGCKPITYWSFCIATNVVLRSPSELQKVAGRMIRWRLVVWGIPSALFSLATGGRVR